MDQISRALLTVGGGTAAPTYVEDVFSTYLYTGNGSTQTITNGIDLAGKGGMVWVKSRSNSLNNLIGGPDLGTGKTLIANSSLAALSNAQYWPAFNSNGFGIGTDATWSTAEATFVSWTFRKAPKFFDVVTYTGDGVTNRAVTHSLGSTPGCIIVKRTDAATDWYVYHRSSNSAWGGTTTGVNAFSNATGQLKLNQTGAFNAGGGVFTYINSTAFGVNFDDSSLNVNTGTYVAYLFAHDAGGFGISGSDNVISCGSFTTDASSVATVNLGWEPQWLLTKSISGTDDWNLFDISRGWSQTNTQYLFASRSFAENPYNYTTPPVNSPTATGFTTNGIFGSSSTYIYMAIRRPNKPPTTGTQVYKGITYTGDGTNNRKITGVGFNSDLVLPQMRDTYGSRYVFDRLRGPSMAGLATDRTLADSSLGVFNSFDMDGFTVSWPSNGRTNESGATFIAQCFKRAPGFFDVVCYKADGQLTKTLSHNLGAAPELIIVKCRTNGAFGWNVYVSGFTDTQYLLLESSAARTTYFQESWRTPFTTSNFSVGYFSNVNSTNADYVAYLFASCPGVSKVGSYTGNGSSQTINCGFTTGARFVMIKRTDSVGDWYVWDTARGIVSANDPHLSLNTTAAEVTTNDSVDPDNTGFIVNQLSATNINVTSATYIYLAIA